MSKFLNQLQNSTIKRIQFLLFVSIFLGTAGISQRSLFINENKVELPFEYVNNFIIVDVMLNNKLPVKFLVDTGAQHILITKKQIAEVLRLEFKKEFKLVGADMERELIAHLVSGVSLKIGKNNAENLQMLVLEEDYFLFEEMTGMNIHGIIGGSFLKNFVIEIDYKRKKLTLHNPNFFKPSKNYEVLPIVSYGNKPYIKTEISFPNSDSILESKLLIDSGAGVTCLLDIGSDEKITVPEKAVPGNIGAGLGGDLIGYIGILPKLNFGSFLLENVPSNFQLIKNDSLEVDDFGRNGLIGNQILDRFKVIIDYRREKLYLQPNKSLKKAFKVDRSGISLISTGWNLRKYLIQSILKESPSWEAGLRPGDQIVSINRIHYNFFSMTQIIKRFKRKEGRMVRLVVKRKGEKLTFKFRLRNLFEK